MDRMSDRQQIPEMSKTSPVSGDRVKSGQCGLGNKMAAAQRRSLSLSPSRKGHSRDIAKTVEPIVNPFVPAKVESLLKFILDAYLHKVKYDPTKCSKIAQDICSVIKAKTKEFHYDQYKLVVQVYVGQDSEQSVQMASRCLWNADVDAFAAATYRNKSLYGIAVVYGLHVDS